MNFKEEQIVILKGRNGEIQTFIFDDAMTYYGYRYDMINYIRRIANDHFYKSIILNGTQIWDRETGFDPKYLKYELCYNLVV